MELAASMGGQGASAIAHGEALVAFAEAVTRGSEELAGARDALRTALGEEAFVEACGIAGIFNGLVRAADLSGIPLDEPTLHGSTDFRESLGLNAFSGALNTALDSADPSLAPARIFEPPSG